MGFKALIIRRDFHIHTTISDGLLRPKKVVARAAKDGVGEMAVADHDSYLGIRQAREAARAHNIAFLTNIELSTRFQNGSQERAVHILGCGYDLETVEADVKFNEYLNYVQDKTRICCEELSAASVQYPFTLSPSEGSSIPISLPFSELESFVSTEFEGIYDRGGQFVIALMNKIRKEIPGINVTIWDIANIVLRLQQEAIENFETRNPGVKIIPNPDFKDAYKASKDSLLQYYYSTSESIKILKALGANPVLAHPGGKGDGVERDEMFKIIGMGIRGIEASSSKHSLEAIEEYTSIAREKGLLVLGGTDYHGEILHPGLKMGMVDDKHLIECDSIETILARR